MARKRQVGDEVNNSKALDQQKADIDSFIHLIWIWWKKYPLLLPFELNPTSTSTHPIHYTVCLLVNMSKMQQERSKILRSSFLGAIQQWIFSTFVVAYQQSNSHHMVCNQILSTLFMSIFWTSPISSHFTPQTNKNSFSCRLQAASKATSWCIWKNDWCLNCSSSAYGCWVFLVHLGASMLP